MADEAGDDEVASHESALMTCGQTPGAILGQSGISCANGPTPVGVSTYTYPPTREVIQ